jgi:hypothetical protein
MKHSRRYYPVVFALLPRRLGCGLTPRRLKTTIKLWPVGLATLVLAVSLLYVGCATTFVPSDAKATCTVTTNGAPPFASWFESGAVTLNGVVKPANSVTFPNTPNCSFYQWSEQMYLWMTSPAPPTYGGGGRIFDSPAFYDVSPPDMNGDRTLTAHVQGVIRDFSVRSAQVGPNNLQLILDKRGRMLEIEPPKLGPSGKQLILNEKGESVEIGRIAIGDNKRATFFDTTGREIQNARPLIRKELNQELVVQKFVIDKTTIFLDAFGNVADVEQGQAGGNAVLMAQNGSLVYYVTMVNDVYAYFLTGTKNGGIMPTPTQFPTSQADLNKIVAFAAGAGPNARTFPDPEALAIEVKSAWVEAAGLANPSSYITMTARIPTYNQANNNQWTKTGDKTVQLALVGIHVVGSTAGHPEMIWATFEHQSNMPNAAYTYINTNNVVTTVPQSTAGNWVFCANNAAAPFNAEHMSFNSPNIDANNAGGFTISPSNTIRWKSWGGAFDVSPNPIAQPAAPSTAASNTEIIAMNNSVRAGLANGDMRANYIMTGATWTIGGVAPSGQFPNGNEVGTSKLSNGTMETYQQGINNMFATGTNCFSCHITNIVNVSKNVQQVSHIFGPIKPLF